MDDSLFKGEKVSQEQVFLLVDDNRDDAFLIELELERMPKSRVCIVQNGEQALDYIQGQPPYNDRYEFPLPDLILLDLKMPGLDGFEVLRWLRNQNADNLAVIPVIVLSDSDSKADIKEAYKAGANFFLTKPVDTAAFGERIRMLGEICASALRQLAAGQQRHQRFFQ